MSEQGLAASSLQRLFELQHERALTGFALTAASVDGLLRFTTGTSPCHPVAQIAEGHLHQT